MSKSITTIHREILKKEYARSPLGLLERRMGKIYDNLYLSKTKLPKEIVDKVNVIRTDNEKAQMSYVEERLKLDREHVDSLLKNSFEKELHILENYLTESTPKTS